MPAKVASTARRLRVLVVEDEAMVALGLEDMLADLGHEVVARAAGLDKALTAARDLAFDLGILDVNIRGKETYAVADVLAGRGIPFIFSTGYDPSRLRQPYCDGPVLQKPYRESDLRKMIGTALG
jgi:CheY-like chemotaxis protein